MPRAKQLGWIHDIPDIRDFPFQASRANPLPLIADLRPWMSPVRDQGMLGSCVGFGVAAGIEYLRRRDEDLFSTTYSPLFLYYQARLLEGWESADTGAYIRDGVKVASKLGAPPENHWPYRIERFTHLPTPSTTKSATRWQLGGYHRCYTLRDVMTAIAEGYPVVGGFSCYSNMFTPMVDRTGDIPMPSGFLEGGHCVLFSGYNQTRQKIEFKNSWGEGWGNAGYGSLPFAYVSNPNLATDFWAMTIESEASYRGRAP